MIIEQGKPQNTGDEAMPAHLRPHRDRHRLLPILAAALTIAVVVACWLAQFRPAAPQPPPFAPSPALAEVKSPPAWLRDELRLDPFYQEYVDDDGLPLLASGKCSPYALLEAKNLVDHLLAHRPAIRTALIDHHVRVVVMASDEMTTDVPEQRDMQPKTYWDHRARGLGGWLVSCGEENLLCCPGDPYYDENILIHEFSHAVQDLAMSQLDPKFATRVDQAFDAAMKAGVWDHSYAASNEHEYFAEGAQAWFDAGRHAPDLDANNGIATRDELKRADPKLAALLTEVFGDDPWRYVRPDRRTTPGDLPASTATRCRPSPGLRIKSFLGKNPLWIEGFGRGASAGLLLFAFGGLPGWPGRRGTRPTRCESAHTPTTQHPAC